MKARNRNHHPGVQCPKCSRTLEAAGEIDIDGTVIPIYTCPECISSAMIGDESMDLPLTFALDQDGRPYDPTKPDDEMYLDGK